MLRIKDDLIKGECVLFLGAGACATSRLKNGELCPLGWKLAEKVHNYFFPDENYNNESLQVVASTVVANRDSKKLHEFLADYLRDIKPSSGLSNLSKLRWHNIYTTNIDLAMETAYSREKDKAQSIIPVVGPMDKGSKDRNTQVSYHKLHGCISRHDVPLVFSLEDYNTSREDHMKLFSKL